jgi:hypothetical protein
VASIADGLTTIPGEVVVIEDVEIVEAEAPSIPAAPFELESVDEWDEVPAETQAEAAEGEGDEPGVDAERLTATGRIDPRTIWGD